MQVGVVGSHGPLAVTHAVVVALLGFTRTARDLVASTGVVLLHHDDLPQIGNDV